MNASITTLKEPDGSGILYPKTRTDAVYDGSSNRLDQTISSLQSDLGSKSSASSVTGNDAFSKISTLNSDLTNLITTQDYDFTGISFSADAIGTRGYQSSVNLGSGPKKVLATNIIYIEDSSKIIPVAFYSKQSDALYLNIYRAVTYAMNSNKVTVRVTWLNA